MKKILLATVIALFTATPVMAACEGGTESNGFCISNIELNWWSASNWCKANGRHLATMYEACPDWDGNIGYGKCPVIASSIDSYIWTATVKDSEYTFFVNPSNGNVEYRISRVSNARGLCQ